MTCIFLRLLSVNKFAKILQVTCVGQVIGAVVADNQAHAQRAAQLVQVTYEDLQPRIITIEVMKLLWSMRSRTNLLPRDTAKKKIQAISFFFCTKLNFLQKYFFAYQLYKLVFV